MTLPVCSHETEVLLLLQGGQWPVAGAPELREHVAACRVCHDTVLVTSTLRAAKTSAARVAALNSPGLLWWRAQLRRRNAAVERVSKPFLGAQIFALAIYVLAAGGLLFSQARYGLRWLEQLAELPQTRIFHFEALLPVASTFASKPEWNWMTVLPTVGLLGLVSGVVVYFATEKN